MTRRTTRITVGGLAAALALGFAMTPPSVADESALDLVLHYDFAAENIDGATVTDLSPRGLDGSINNVANAVLADGILELPGGRSQSNSAPFVTIPGGVFEGLSAATITTRLRWDGGDDFQWVYNLGKDKDNATFLTPSFGGDPRSRSSIKPVNGGTEVGVSGAEKFPTDTWIDAVTVIDESTITYYLNGIRVGSTGALLDLDAVMHSATISGFIGKPFWDGHPFFGGAIDDFRVYGAALSAEEVEEIYGSDLPELVGLEQAVIELSTPQGAPPALPASVKATYTDGITRAHEVFWDEVDPTSYETPGNFSVLGSVQGTSLTVEANITVTFPGQMTIDLGASTGDFHGGASGTLYGVYDQGLPSSNLIDAIKLRTVATKAQDGPQHPGADALEVVKPLADSSDGDVYIYMTDIHRGFPYQWSGSTPEEKMDIYLGKLADQVDQILSLPAEYQDNIVLMPYNEPEGNMFGTGDWSYNRRSWLDDPTDFFAAWDRTYRQIKTQWPEARIGGPNTSILYNQVRGFMEHTVEADTVPDVIAWHELSNPATIRSSVDRYRGWEKDVFAGTSWEGTELPINITEYAFNYHTSVPGQMIQWISALEDKKVFGDIAYWNIDGNLSDSAVQANRANGQWWLLNAYAQMSGQTVRVEPPEPDVSYTLQGVATLDDEKAQVRALIGGAEGTAYINFENVPTELLGDQVHVEVKEIGWSGQIGDSANPPTLASYVADVTSTGVLLHFGGEHLPVLKEESAYQIIITPGENATVTATHPHVWEASYEAEQAARVGDGWSVNGPEGSPTDQGKFYTSGGYNVGGIRTGTDVKLDFTVDVPQGGMYDLSIFANSLNTYDMVAQQGPTNVFVSVNNDPETEQEVFMPLGYKWVVWDHADTTVELTTGRNTITLAAQSMDGSRATRGDVIIDKIDLSLANGEHAEDSYEAEYAELNGARATYSTDGSSGAGGVQVDEGQSVTFWVYSRDDATAGLELDVDGPGSYTVSVNGNEVADSSSVQAFLVGGINKVVVTGNSGTTFVDRLRVGSAPDAVAGTSYEAEDATTSGTATATELSLASGGLAVTDVGGAPGNTNTLVFDSVEVSKDGRYAVTVRYSNEEQSQATHYNPDPLARYAHVSVNGDEPQTVVFPHSFHRNNFWELTFYVDLEEGANSIEFSSEEKHNFDGETYASEVWPGILLRSQFAPVIDKITVTQLSDHVEGPDPTDPPTEPTEPPTTDPTNPPTTDPTEPPTKPTVPAGDLYTTPGFHKVNGRWWHTACEPYSQTIRCRTEIWATQVTVGGGRFVSKTGWHFNNLTYLPFMSRAQWAANPLGHDGQWTAADGRKWRTECDTPVSGRNGCRSFAWAAFVSSAEQADGTWAHSNEQGWVFNNIVRFRQN